MKTLTTRGLPVLIGLVLSAFSLSIDAQNADTTISWNVSSDNTYGIEAPLDATKTFTASGNVLWVPPYSPAQQKAAAVGALTNQINNTSDWSPTTKNNAIYVLNHVVWDDTQHTVAHGGQTFRYTASQEICPIGDCDPRYRHILTYLTITGPL